MARSDRLHSIASTHRLFIVSSKEKPKHQTPENPMKSTINFTQEQLADWLAYEEVRQGGEYNMFDPRARQACCLTEDEYRFVMKHYSALKDAQPKTEGKTHNEKQH